MAVNLSRFRRWIKQLADALQPPRRVEVTVQTERVVILRRRRSMRVWCPQCAREVEAVGLQDVSSPTGAMRPSLPGNAGSEAWHVCTGRDGEPVICLESLLKTG